VFLDGLDAEAEIVGDVLVGVALGDEFQHLALAVGQQVPVAADIGCLAGAQITMDHLA
jgi:hypothetical protein